MFSAVGNINCGILRVIFASLAKIIKVVKKVKQLWQSSDKTPCKW